MARKVVTEAGFYAGQYLQAGQTYSDDASPVKVSKRDIAEAEKAVEAAKQSLENAEDAGRTDAQAALSAAEVALAALKV